MDEGYDQKLTTVWRAPSLLYCSERVSGTGFDRPNTSLGHEHNGPIMFIVSTAIQNRPLYSSSTVSLSVHDGGGSVEIENG